MKNTFIIFTCFILGNLNYYIFFEKGSSRETRIRFLPTDKSFYKKKTLKLNGVVQEEDKDKPFEEKKDLFLETQIKDQKEDQSEDDISISSEEEIDALIEDKVLMNERQTVENNDIFLEEEISEEDLKNDPEENKKLQVLKKSAKIKKGLEKLFSKNTYPWVKRISTNKAINSQRGELLFYPWGLWKGQYLGFDGKIRQIWLRLKRKQHELKDLVNLNLKVGKGSNLHLAISKTLALNTTNKKEFLKKFHYFSFSIDKNLLLILFKNKKRRVFKGMIKLKNSKKERLLGTFRLKKVHKRLN